MKKIYLVLGIAVLLASCSAKKENKDQVTAEAKTAIATESHNAQNSLDVNGTYEGKLPTASGEGMELKITLSGDTYKKSVAYIGKSEKPFETSGKFTWDKSGSVITLVGEEAPNKYFVGENTLTHLDTDGQKITGDLANMYILKKE